MLPDFRHTFLQKCAIFQQNLTCIKNFPIYSIHFPASSLVWKANIPDASLNLIIYMSCLMTKPTKWMCAQRRLWSAWAGPSLCTHWVAKDPSFLDADSEGSDQTGQMPRLIWVFAGRTGHSVGFVMRQLVYVISDLQCTPHFIDPVSSCNKVTLNCIYICKCPALMFLIMSPPPLPKWEWDIMFLVRIPLVLASVWHFLICIVCTVSHELVARF